MNQYGQDGERLGGHDADEPPTVETSGQAGLVWLDGQHGQHAMCYHEPEHSGDSPEKHGHAHGFHLKHELPNTPAAAAMVKNPTPRLWLRTSAANAPG